VTNPVAKQGGLTHIAKGFGGFSVERAFLVLLAFFCIFPADSRAQINPTRACDLAAASPTDLGRPADIPGVSIEKIDPEVALPACQAALGAAPENPRLLFEMGRVSQASKDDNQARAFYEKAVAHGYATAQSNLAVYYINGRGGLTKSDEQAARLFKLAAAQGDAGAQFSLGLFFESGRGGLPKDDREAARYFKLAAAQGDASAQFNLGLFFESGRGGLPKDDRGAARYFKLAADRDNPDAQFMLGAFYETGRGGLPKNDEEAKRLYKIAADHRSTLARFHFGGFYATGGVSLPPDWMKAFQAQLVRYWTLPPGIDPTSKLRVMLRVQLNPDGTLSQTPSTILVPASSAGLEFLKSAVKALELTQPFTMLKPENYNQWKDMEIVFDSKMLPDTGPH
jgi:TPR repeat protein